MKHAMQRQRGFGLISLIFYLAIAMFIVTVVVKLGPTYMEYLTVRSVMKELTEDPSLANGGKKDIMRALSNRLYINDVKGVNNKLFKYKRNEEGYLVSIEYQSQEHLFANVDVILTFRHAVQVGRK